MATRTPSKNETALVTIEVSERLAVHAYASIERGDTTEAMRLLAELVNGTTATTCSQVKDQRLSDRIAAKAVARVTEIGVWPKAALS